jgi:hypothetical protein
MPALFTTAQRLRRFANIFVVGKAAASRLAHNKNR